MRRYEKEEKEIGKNSMRVNHGLKGKPQAETENYNNGFVLDNE